MVAWADRQALEATLASGEMHYHSRRTGNLWHKGETTGSYQRLVSLVADCDSDTLLATVRQEGVGACHTGALTCFDPTLDEPLEVPEDVRILGTLLEVITQRSRELPGDSYTARLVGDRALALRKVAEEAIEVVIAAGHQGQDRTCEEAADLLYHLLVVLHVEGIDLQDVWATLAQRHNPRRTQDVRLRQDPP